MMKLTIAELDAALQPTDAALLPSRGNVLSEIRQAILQANSGWGVGLQYGTIAVLATELQAALVAARDAQEQAIASFNVANNAHNALKVEQMARGKLQKRIDELTSDFERVSDELSVALGERDEAREQLDSIRLDDLEELPE